MLKALRKKETVKKIFIILAIVIIPAFVFWGSGSVLRSKQKGMPNYAGKIFNKKVSFPEYQASLNAAKNQAIMQFGDNFYKVKKYLNLNQQAWERLILGFEAKKRDLNVSNQELVTQIRQIGFFQKDNKFNQKLYETTINYVFRTTPRDFEEQMRDSLMIAKLYEQVIQDVNVTEQEILKAYKQEFEKVKVSFLSFPQSAKQEAEQTLRNIQQILEKKPNSNFKDIAKSLKLKVNQTPAFDRNDSLAEVGNSPEFISAAFDLKTGQISPVIEAGENFYILWLDEIIPIDEEKFAAEKTQFREWLLALKQKQRFVEFFLDLKKKANLVDNIKDLQPPEN